MMMDRVAYVFAGIEVARRLRESLAAQKLLENFLDSYSSTYDRAGLRSSPLRYRELLTTINREVWLAVTARVTALLAGKIPPPGKAPVTGAENQAADGFRGALLDEVGKYQHWMPSDRAEFEHDLALYAHIAARGGIRSARGAVAEGAFVDRCALLLDPSMLEDAAAAAGKFLAQLEALADATFADVFGVQQVRPIPVVKRKKAGKKKRKAAKKKARR